MLKKRYLIIATIITFMLAAGITLAFMLSSTQNVTNDFTPAVVTCRTNLSYSDAAGNIETDEKNDSDTNAITDGDSTIDNDTDLNGNTGNNIESSGDSNTDGESLIDYVTVTNTGNISEYIRIRVISHWEDESGNIVGKASEMPELTISNDWMYDDENDVYYYSEPVEVNKDTSNLLTQSYTLKSDTYNDKTVYQVVEFLSEAIQAEPQKAVTEAWGITVE
jgi:hypothetical protein